MLSFLFNEKGFYTLLIIVAVALILFALIKYEHARPLLVTVLCVAWLGLGLYSGLTWYNYNSTISKVRGEPVVRDPYENFNFYDYHLNNIVWYQTEDGTYEYEITYATSLKFDGTEEYQLLVNNSPCKETTSANGRLQGTFEKQFKDIDGQVSGDLEFKINFAFYASKITLKITTNATTENIGLVREYVNVNGFDLRIIKAVYNSN